VSATSLPTAKASAHHNAPPVIARSFEIFSSSANICTAPEPTANICTSPLLETRSQRSCSGLSDAAREFVNHSLSPSSQRAYRADLAHFLASGYGIPSSPNEVADYIATLAQMLKPATISRRLVSIAKAHRALGHFSPVNSEIVKATLKGLRRKCGVAQRQAKPVMTDDLHRILDALPASAKGRRDKALLLLGFAGGFRRSELVGIDHDHIQHVRQGIVVTLPRSKTDQEGRGRTVGIPFGRGRHCPVTAVEAWLEIAGIKSGPVFRPINKHNHIAADRLSGEAVSILVKDAVRLAGLNPDLYSGHSLRAGLATSAAMAGVPSWKIRAQTGHASDAMLARYIRDGDLFTDNAAGRIL
jgi:integrase